MGTIDFDFRPLIVCAFVGAHVMVIAACAAGGAALGGGLALWTHALAPLITGAEWGAGLGVLVCAAFWSFTFIGLRR